LVDAVNGHDDILRLGLVGGHLCDVFRVQVKPEHVIVRIIDKLVVLLAAENVVERDLIGRILVEVSAPELEFENARVVYCKRRVCPSIHGRAKGPRRGCTC